MSAMPKGYDAVRSAALGFGRFRKRWFVLDGLGRFVAVGPGLLLAWFLLDWGIGLPAWPLFLSLVLIGAVSLWAAARWLVRPQLRRVAADREALLIESLRGDLDNQLIGSLQLGREIAEAAEGAGQGRRLGYSPLLVEELVGRTAKRVASLDFTELVDRRGARKALACGGAVAVAVLCCLVFGQAAVRERIVRLGRAYAAILDALFPVEMRVTPGDLAVVRCRPVTLGVEVVGARQDSVTLVRTDAETNEAASEALALAGGKAEFRIESAETSFSYRFEYAGRPSETYRVLVGDIPEVSTISYEMVCPAYTGQPSRTLTGRIPKLQGLRGTGVLVSFATTTELHPDLSFVEWGDGTRQALSISGRFGHFSFTIDRPDRASLRLTGKHGRGFENPTPLGLEIAVEPDNAPSVDIKIRKDKLTLFAEEAAAFAVPFVAEDDFGVAEVTLQYRIDTVDEMLKREPRQSSSSRLIEPPQDRVRGAFAGMFKDLTPPLLPGDRIRIHLTAKDNNSETGPGAGRSRTLEIVVVRPDLGIFTESRFGFDEQAGRVLAGLSKVKRSTDLLVEPPKTVRTEKPQAVERQPVQARTAPEIWPSGSEDATGAYFRLLSGGR